MVARGVIPQDLMDALPPAEAYERAVFPSVDAVNANSEGVKAGWDSVVGANVVQ
jgi:putative spermidine/putrescine transport system substrate-binding protein